MKTPQFAGFGLNSATGTAGTAVAVFRTFYGFLKEGIYSFNHLAELLVGF